MEDGYPPRGAGGPAFFSLTDFRPLKTSMRVPFGVPRVLRCAPFYFAGFGTPLFPEHVSQIAPYRGDPAFRAETLEHTLLVVLEQFFALSSIWPPCVPSALRPARQIAA